MKKEEILERIEEIKSLLQGEEEVDVRALNDEYETLKVELAKAEETEEEERKLAEVKKLEAEAEERRVVAEKLNNGSVKGEVIKEEKEEMKSRDEMLASVEYRNYWAKTLMGRNDITEEERAVGDAITTTATTFVQSTSGTQGINNAGLFIPTSVREALMERLEMTSPFLRDATKLEVKGVVNLPFIADHDEAQWLGETTPNVNEGIEFAQLTLGAFDLTKYVEITWNVLDMAIDSFIDYIVGEVADAMYTQLAYAVISGNGSGQPTGAMDGLTPVKIPAGKGIVDAIIGAYNELPAIATKGAKVYVSNSVATALYGYRDGSGNYPFLSGLPVSPLFTIEVDPFVTDGYALVGNAKNYVINFNHPLEIMFGDDLKTRRRIVSAYMKVDGKAKPNAFAVAQNEEEGE